MKTLNIHKEELSPYNAINEYITKTESYAHEVSNILVNNVAKVLGLSLKKAVDDHSPLIFKGNIQYNAKTGKPITMAEWNKLEEAIAKYLKIEKNILEKKLGSGSYWLGDLLNKMDLEQRRKAKLTEIERIEEEPDFEEFGYTDYDIDRVNIAQRLSGIYLQNITDKARTAIQSIITQGEKNHLSHGELFQKLWDQQDDINRDWDRVIRTETAMNANAGLLTSILRASDEEHIFVKGISAPNACKYCKGLIDNRIAVLLPGPPKGGSDKIKIGGQEYTAIWPGKSNYGRSTKDYWAASIIHPYCYSDDTELLTNEGWKLFSELKGKEKVFGINTSNFEVGWVSYKKIVSYNYNGKMVNLKSKCVDLLITKDHNNLVKTIGGEWVEKKTAGLNISDRLPKAVGRWEGKDPEFFDIGNVKLTTLQYVRLMAWYLSEGSLNRDNYINIAQDDVEKVFKDLCDLPIPVQKGKTKLYIKSKDINYYMKKFGHAKDKYIPEELKNLSKFYLEEFLRVYMLGDGNERIKKCNIRGYIFSSYRRYIATTSKKMEADISELMIKIGKFPSFSVAKHGRETRIRRKICKTINDVFNIHETKSKTVGFKKKLIHYKGKVYDIEMNKWHFFLVRRNGKAVWRGNCRCTWTEWMLEIEQYMKDI